MSAHGSTDHPVGVAFPLFDRGYRPENVVKSRGVSLPGGTVQCSSCHDPHNQSGAAAMLVIPNVGSALCLACHNK
jgi:predicted CXXCH cytochrome family protein